MVLGLLLQPRGLYENLALAVPFVLVFNFSIVFKTYLKA